MKKPHPDFSSCEALKAKIDAQRPFSVETLRSLHAYYQIGLTHSSNALEGNRLTLSETRVVLEDGLTIGGKPLRDILETLGLLGIP